MSPRLACIVAFVAAACAAPLLEESEYASLFNKWRKEHSVEYESFDEMSLRYEIFKINMDFIIRRRSESLSHTVAMNKFGDMSNAEFRAMFNGYSASGRARLRKGRHSQRLRIPSAVNWVTAGAVTPVKNQGQCGSCWSFSTTGSVEGINEITNGKLVSLSEQELVDCSTQNAGCSGGEMQLAFQWIIQNGGLCSEAAYPYNAANGTCQSSSCQNVPGSGIKNFVNVIPNNETDLLYAVAQQPVSVAVDAGGMDWQFYSGGVVNDPNCGTQLDHGVLAAGYDTLNGQPYWLVKNSWGADWGANGYIYLARGATTNQPGTCGIAMDGSYPTY